MVDGFDDVLGQVDLAQNVSAIAEVEDAIDLGGPQGDGSSDEGPGPVEDLAAEVDLPSAWTFRTWAWGS